jgi:hypothetical protein
MMERRETWKRPRPWIVPVWLKETLPDGSSVWESDDGTLHYYGPTRLRRFWNRLKLAFWAPKLPKH